MTKGKMIKGAFYAEIISTGRWGVYRRNRHGIGSHHDRSICTAFDEAPARQIARALNAALAARRRLNEPIPERA